MEFNNLLDKINQNIQNLFEQESIDLDLASKEVEDYLITLESKFSDEYLQWVNQHQVLVKYKEHEVKLLKYLKDHKLSYSVVAELNQIYLKDDKNHVIQTFSLINIDKVLKELLQLDKNSDHFYLLKSLLSKNHRLEVMTLSHGLKL